MTKEGDAIYMLVASGRQDLIEDRVKQIAGKLSVSDVKWLLFLLYHGFLCHGTRKALLRYANDQES